MQKEMQEIPLASLRRIRANARAGAALGGLAAAAAKASGGSSDGSAGGGAGGPGGSSSSRPNSSGGGGSSRLTNVRTSTANIMELGRVSHAATQQGEQVPLISPSTWAPISPVE